MILLLSYSHLNYIQTFSGLEKCFALEENCRYGFYILSVFSGPILASMRVFVLSYLAENVWLQCVITLFIFTRLRYSYSNPCKILALLNYSTSIFLCEWELYLERFICVGQKCVNDNGHRTYNKHIENGVFFLILWPSKLKDISIY